jgi:hypothetical protein
VEQLRAENASLLQREEDRRSQWEMQQVIFSLFSPRLSSHGLQFTLLILVFAATNQYADGCSELSIPKWSYRST